MTTPTHNPTQQAVTHAHQQSDRFLAELREFLQIPSISTLPAHRPDIARAAAWLAANLHQAGLHNIKVLPTEGNPVVYADWLNAGADAPTVLIYGHYDVQPVDPLGDWLFPPFSATVADGKVWARGASDNKAQHFSHIKALESILAANGKLPVNVKLFLDGEEEVGSPSLPGFIQANAALFAADLVLISDGPMLTAGQPSIDYAIRGLAAAEVILTGPARDLHSGNYGGSVHNPAQALAELIAALHDAEGAVTIPGFYDAVRPLTAAQKAALAAAPYPLEQWLAETGAPAPWGEPAYSLLERITARPTLEVNGLWSGFQGEGIKTIIPSTAGAKFTMRLVADQDPDDITDRFETHVRALLPPTVQVEVIRHAGARAAVTAIDGPGITAARAAYLHGWGVEPVLKRMGGSLPIVATFQQVLGTPFVLMPLGLDDNRHSPNEHYHLDYLTRGIDTAIHFYYAYAHPFTAA